MHVLVTGAGGFCGSWLVPALLERGHTVTAVAGRGRGRLDPGLDGNRSLTVVTGNLAEPLDLPQRIDAIVHTAARSPAPCVRASDMLRDNTMATSRLLGYAAGAGAGTFIYFSSLSIYGDITGPV